MIITPFLLFFIIIGSVTTEKTEPRVFKSKHAILYSHLMESYELWNPDRNIPPIVATKKPIDYWNPVYFDPVNVKFGLTLKKLIRYDDVNNIATLSIWERTEWVDNSIHWNSEKRKILALSVPKSKIWIPDIIMYDTIGQEARTDSMAVVYSDGTVSIVSPITRDVYCEEEDTEIVCNLKYGSWTMAGNKLNVTLQSDNVDLHSYIPHPLYNVTDVSAVRNANLYDCCPEVYIDLVFSLKFAKQNKQ